MALGIDLGTTGLKTIALSADGRVLGKTRVAYTSIDPRISVSEQDPAVWVEALRLALVALGNDVDFGDVVAVGLSGQTHGLLITDTEGLPLAPCMTWADARCHQEAEDLRAAVGLYVMDRCANPIEEAFTAPKMLWAARHQPSLVRGGRLTLPKDYLRWILTGQWATDPSDAASTLLFDLREQSWSASLASEVGWRIEQLPPVIPSSSIAGRITAACSAITGIAEGTPVVTGGSDVACAALGAGLVGPGPTYINLGTAAQVLTLADEPRPGPHYIFQHCLPGAFLAMGSLHSAGLALRWFVESFPPAGVRPGESTYRHLDEMAQLVPAGSRGVVFLPYLVPMSRAPSSAAAQGAFAGLTADHGWAECSRAVLEGVGYGLKGVMSEMDTGAGGELLFGGGGASSKLWASILASIFDRSLSVLSQESSPLGAAMLAGIGVGLFSDAADAILRGVRMRSRHEPQPCARDTYDVGYHMFVAMRDRLRSISPDLCNSAPFRPRSVCQ